MGLRGNTRPRNLEPSNAVQLLSPSSAWERFRDYPKNAGLLSERLATRCQFLANVPNGGNSRARAPIVIAQRAGARVAGEGTVVRRAAWNLAALARGWPLYSVPLAGSMSGMLQPAGTVQPNDAFQKMADTTRASVVMVGDGSGMELARIKVMRRQSAQEQ